MADLHPEVLKAIEAGPQSICDHYVEHIPVIRNESLEEFARRIAAFAVEKEREEVELVGWIQQIGSRLAFFEGDTDPRTVHDNGKPCYPVYRRRGKP